MRCQQEPLILYAPDGFTACGEPCVTAWLNGCNVSHAVAMLLTASYLPDATVDLAGDDPLDIRVRATVTPEGQPCMLVPSGESYYLPDFGATVENVWPGPVVLLDGLWADCAYWCAGTGQELTPANARQVYAWLAGL